MLTDVQRDVLALAAVAIAFLQIIVAIIDWLARDRPRLRSPANIDVSSEDIDISLRTASRRLLLTVGLFLSTQIIIYLVTFSIWLNNGLDGQWFAKALFMLQAGSCVISLLVIFNSFPRPVRLALFYGTLTACIIAANVRFGPILAQHKTGIFWMVGNQLSVVFLASIALSGYCFFFISIRIVAELSDGSIQPRRPQRPSDP